MNSDPSGQFFDTFLDIVSVITSFVDFITKPSLGTGVTLAYDCAAAVMPIVPASSTLKLGKKVSSTFKFAEKASSSKNVISKGLASVAGSSGYLNYLGNGKWKSTGGLIYGQGSVHGNRVKHVLDHTVANANKAKHTIFNVDKSKVIPLVDEAWKLRGNGNISRGNEIFDISMGRVIGTNGETSIKIITKAGSNDIITAFPIP